MRPDSPANFTRRIDEVQRPQGYRVIGSFVDGSDEAVAVIGFRLVDSLALGHYCYIEDVIALPNVRKDGHAQALMDWVAAEARSHNCARIVLNSGVARHAAHRFYMNERFVITAFHFTRDLS